MYRITAILTLLTLAMACPIWSATVLNTPGNNLRVKVDSFVTDAFPVVEALVTIDAPLKTDFRYLSADNVGVIEEEVPVRALRVEPFYPPLSLALVLDDSGSLRNKLPRLKESVDHFITELGDRDETAIISFNRSVQVLQELTYSKATLRQALGTLQAYGATALYDGIVAGIEQIARASGKRTLIVVSDGNDQVYPGGRALSRLNIRQAIQAARKHNVEIYTIGIGKRLRHNLLVELAQKTGGFFWNAPDPKYLKPVFDAVTRSFQSRARIIYESPNANFTRLDRTIVVDVRMGKYSGRGVGTYWLDRDEPAAKLTIKRKTVQDSGLAKLRLFTWGIGRTPLEMEFFLFDHRGNLVRHGFTTQDGFGKLKRSRSPQLTDVPPGYYRLVLRREGTELDFDHPDIYLAPSRTLTMSLGFSKLVFRRDGKTWFDLQHDYGPTSELIEVRVEDQASGCSIYRGRLVDFCNNRETACWIQEGAYRVVLDNKWSVVRGRQRQAAVLKNELEADFQVKGGRKLYFDTRADDFLLPDDVLSRDYLIAHADESPFRAPTPRTKAEIEGLASQKARRYREGAFSRYREHHLDTDSLYPFIGEKTARLRIGELIQERLPRRSLREEAAERISQRRPRPYMNERLNKLYPDIMDRKGPSLSIPGRLPERRRRPVGRVEPLSVNAEEGLWAPIPARGGAAPHRKLWEPTPSVPRKQVMKNASTRINNIRSLSRRIRQTSAGHAKEVIGGSLNGNGNGNKAAVGYGEKPGAKAEAARATFNRPNPAISEADLGTTDPDLASEKLDELLSSIKREIGSAN